MMVGKSSATGVTPRAPRFPVEMPIRFRAIRGVKWRAGSTENVSRSGVLFRSDERMGPKSRLEMEFVLPAEVFGVPVARVNCHGQVVRVEPPAAGRDQVRLAATIADYRFVSEYHKPKK